MYLIYKPFTAEPQCLKLTTDKNGFFYHMGIWRDMNGDGRKDLLTARVNKPIIGASTGELLWLEQPVNPTQLAPSLLASVPVPVPVPVPVRVCVLDLFPCLPAHSLPRTTVFSPLLFDGTKRNTPWKEHVLTQGPEVIFQLLSQSDFGESAQGMRSQGGREEGERGGGRK